MTYHCRKSTDRWVYEMIKYKVFLGRRVIWRRLRHDETLGWRDGKVSERAGVQDTRGPGFRNASKGVPAYGHNLGNRGHCNERLGLAGDDGR